MFPADDLTTVEKDLQSQRLIPPLCKLYKQASKFYFLAASHKKKQQAIANVRKRLLTLGQMPPT